jgi:hypothetical protein
MCRINSIERQRLSDVPTRVRLDKLWISLRMQRFNPRDYPAPVAALLRSAGLNSLGPGQAQTDCRRALEALDVDAMVGSHQVVDRQMAQACLAGLWLRHDFLDESHHVSQQIETPTGSFWHGIMHRREPDHENAKYWFRRVGCHPIFAALAEAARELSDELGAPDKELSTQIAWEPLRFVDLCRQARPGSPMETLCQRIQRVEWELLFDHGYRQAIHD